MPVLCTNISPGLRVRTSLDTQRRLPYNPHTPPKPKRSPNDFAPSPAVTLTNNCTDRSGADLLKRRLDQGNPIPSASSHWALVFRIHASFILFSMGGCMRKHTFMSLSQFQVCVVDDKVRES